MLKQSQIDKITEVNEQNQEVALDFARPFQNTEKGKKGKKRKDHRGNGKVERLVSIDHFSGWPIAKFLHCPTTKKVIELLKQYIAHYGVPKKIRTCPGTVLLSEAFAKFCKQFGIVHITYPVRDHRGNGKVERLVRTNNE